MANGKFVAYYRTSTQRQSLGLEAQQAAVMAYLNGGRWTLVAEYQEQESGKRSDNRPALQEALAHCKKAKATLVIAKLDRLSRNVAFISALMESGVEFIACDLPNANKLTLHILAAVAEHEREMISKRTSEALQALKANGKRLGVNARENGAKAASVHADTAQRHAVNVLPIVQDLQAKGCKTLRQIAEALNARGIKTARGGAWHATTVKNVLDRAA